MEYEASLKRIENTSDIVNCFIKSQAKSNENRISAGLEPIRFEVFDFEPENGYTVKTGEYKIPDSSCYYHLTNIKLDENNWVLKSTILTGKETLITVNLDPNDSPISSSEKIIKEKENPFQPKTFSIIYLENKINQIKLKMRNMIVYDANFNPIESNCPEGCQYAINRGNPSRHCLKNIACDRPRIYTIDDLSACNNRIGLSKIKDELHIHGHAKSKIVKGKQSSVEERRKELIDHYKNFHNQN